MVEHPHIATLVILDKTGNYRCVRAIPNTRTSLKITQHQKKETCNANTGSYKHNTNDWTNIAVYPDLYNLHVFF